MRTEFGLTLSTRLWISLFLSSIDTTIVATALIKITDELHGLDKAQWIVVAYLISLSGKSGPGTAFRITRKSDILQVSSSVWRNSASSSA
jgi:hypothetical protein